jgi:hypothetical protein
LPAARARMHTGMYIIHAAIGRRKVHQRSTWASSEQETRGGEGGGLLEVAVFYNTLRAVSGREEEGGGGAGWEKSWEVWN